jgi:hypothetical protein
MSDFILRKIDFIIFETIVFFFSSAIFLICSVFLIPAIIFCLIIEFINFCLDKIIFK